MTRNEDLTMIKQGAVFAILLLLLSAGSAESLTVVPDHPRIFLTQSDLPRLRARCGIIDGNNQSQYANQWLTHLVEFTTVTVYATGLESVLSDLNGAVWSKTVARDYSEYFAATSLVALLSGNPLLKAKLTSWWDQVIDDSKDINGGQIGMSMRENDYGKNAVWMGYCMAYDYLYDDLSITNPSLRDDIALWLYKQTEDGYDLIGGNDDNPVGTYDHYYKFPWVADGVFASFLTVYGDPGVASQGVPAKLTWAHTFKQYDNDSRARNFCGTYSGYRDERIEEDVCTGLAWDSAVSDEDPIQTYGFHFLNLDDWLMYMTRPNFFESDETGDKHDMNKLHTRWVVYGYPMATRDRDPHTLWFLDRAAGVVNEIDVPWQLILWNDKAIARIQPTAPSVPLSRYFGDLTPNDGYNSQYTHMRSSWNYSATATDGVHASFLCGPSGITHDQHSNGHLAIFRGSDILTASTGIYDATNKPHSMYYHMRPNSENTILIEDPDNPYIDGEEEDILLHAEGCQMPAPGTGGGGGIYDPDDPYDYRHEFGFVTRFTTLEDGSSYLLADFTTAYPNTRKPDMWPDGQTVENVTRQVAFQGSKFFIVCDRITTVRTTAKKRVVMHCPSMSGYSLLDGQWNGGVAPHSVQYGGTPGQWSDNGLSYRSDKGGSRLFATVLYPAPVALGGEGRKLVRVGGTNSAGQWNVGTTGNTSFEFYLRASQRNYAWDDEFLSDLEIDNHVNYGWVGFWRMEIEATGAKEHTFLHVYEATSTSQGAATAVVYLEEIDSEHVGCKINDSGTGRIQVYSRDEDPDTEVIYKGEFLLPVRHLLADLVPGEYLVEETSSGFELTVQVGEAHLAAFTTPSGGSFRVRRIGPESTAPIAGN